MSRYYVHNLETDKLNIFTAGKSDWMTIPAADRERIKNACLWSRSLNGWVSRCKGGRSRFYALDGAVPGIGYTPEIAMKYPFKYPYTEVQEAR